MQQSFTSIPFKTESGMSSIDGIAKFSSAGIVVEFESKLFGIVANGVKECRVPIADILDIKFRKGIFRRGAKIELRTKSFAKLAELPNNNGKITLKIMADDFDRAKTAVAQMERYVAEHTQSLPPPHTPLQQIFADDTEETTKELTDRT